MLSRELKLPATALNDTVYLVFHPARSRIARRQENGSGYEWLPDGKSPQALAQNVLALRVSAESGPSTVRVESLDGPAELSTIVHVVSSIRGVKSAKKEKGDETRRGKSVDEVFVYLADDLERPLVSRPLDALATLLPGPDDYLEALWLVLDPAPRTNLWNYRRFFADLDRHTEVTLRKLYLKKLAPKYLGRLEPALQATMATLWDSLKRRSLDPTHQVRCPPYGGKAHVVEDLKVVSELFLRLVFKYFQKSRGALDLDNLEDAFEMFANGELRLLLDNGFWTTQPSSGLYFFFAEFALLCANVGVETQLWTRLANVMVRSQRIYCRVYEPEHILVEKRHLFSYTADDFSAKRMETRSEKDALCGDFEDLGLDALCICAARHLDEFAPATAPYQYPKYHAPSKAFALQQPHPCSDPELISTTAAP